MYCNDVTEGGRGGSGGGNGSGGGSGSFTKIKEKNRLAQQRFRQKQKNMVATLKARLGELEEMVRRGGGEVKESEGGQGERE